MTRTLAAFVLVAALAFATCGDAGDSSLRVGRLPDIDPGGARALLAESEDPVVLNIWASWCVPCRSEAPLLRSAHGEFGDEVRFVFVAVRDNQSESVEFINEFGLGGLEHFFDADGAVPASLGGFGVPLTFFFDAGGELVELHSGIIDERTLVLGIDELMRRNG